MEKQDTRQETKTWKSNSRNHQTKPDKNTTNRFTVMTSYIVYFREHIEKYHIIANICVPPFTEFCCVTFIFRKVSFFSVELTNKNQIEHMQYLIKYAIMPYKDTCKRCMYEWVFVLWSLYASNIYDISV